MSRKRDFELNKLENPDYGLYAFVLAIIAGASWVALSKSILNLPGVWVASGTVAILLGYVLAMLTIKRINLRRDQVGDNTYYLGFILTLCSLTVTLIQYSQNADEDYIISNFGVALAATVVGVMVRSVLNQMRRDVATVERDVQQQLSVASGKLTGQISVTIENFATLNRHMEQAALETIMNIGYAQEKLVEEFATKAQQATDSVEKSFKSAATSIEESATTFSVKMDSSAEEYVSTVDKLTSGMSDQVDRISNYLDRIEDIDKQSLDLIETVSDLRSKAAESNKELRALVDGLDKARSETSSVANNLSDLAGAIGETNELHRNGWQKHFELIQEEHQKLAELSTAHRDRVQASALDQMKQADELRTIATTLKSTISELDSSASALDGFLSTLKNTVLKRLASTNEAVEKLDEKTTSSSELDSKELDNEAGSNSGQRD